MKTPKKKAKELVDKFRKHTWNGEDNLDNKNAKKCALIAVDEILNQDKNVFDIYEREYHFEYWGNVKDEIEKI
jgi:hypothetical protein